MSLVLDGDGITVANLTSAAKGELKSGRKNLIINGGFDVWQRGTSFTNPVGDTFTADRFFAVSGGATTGDTISRQTFTVGQTDVPNNPTYFLRFSVGSASSNRVMHHRIEDVRNGAGQTCTLSFWGKASTSHSSTIEIQQNFGSGGSTAVTQSPVSYSLTTSWQKFTFNINMPSISGKTIGSSSYIYIAFIRSLPASNVDIDIAQMQFELGDTATDFEHRSYGEELALCQRYYYKQQSSFSADSTTSFLFNFQFPVTMRTSPSVSYSWGGVDGDFYKNSDATTPSFASPNGLFKNANGITTGYKFGTSFTKGDTYTTQWELDAEL